MHKSAFSLAEMITTLVVIGVVATLTIPIFYHSADDKVLEKQRQAFSYKFNDGLEEMKVNDKLSEEYSSTEDFVTAMKKYFKITNICYNNNLQKCFTEEFTYRSSSGSNNSNNPSTNINFRTENIKTMSNLASIMGVSKKYDSNFVGIVFSDDTRMLIAYNSDCQGPTAIEDTDNYTKCFDYIADINGNNAPNEVGNDILTNISMPNL